MLVVHSLGQEGHDSRRASECAFHGSKTGWKTKPRCARREICLGRVAALEERGATGEVEAAPAHTKETSAARSRINYHEVLPTGPFQAHPSRTRSFEDF
eukprot:1183487-Prorocentrum_minimum.AAC.4